MNPNLRTAFGTFAIAAGMLGLAYASVPLYELFCRVTGFGGTTQVAASTAGIEQTDVPISVRFDANTAPGLGWEFKPVKTSETVMVGQRKLAFYQAKNENPYPVTGVATFNVSPDTAGKYFSKIQCFCFNEQTLQPGQAVTMPVSYFVDPEFLNDPDAVKIEEITLSYTFFPTATETASSAPKSDTRG
ncbi:MAG: cytochrome c oxidase assembly protein [Pacificimonas sp.]|jgi:cytochrome c oxidase assembly protein subunit 11|nr:cytochrome c oxidase assembly protein [Pacificimonas sp.]